DVTGPPSSGRDRPAGVVMTATRPAVTGPAHRRPRAEPSMRKIVLVSNQVMHYRVPVYNWFARRFAETGWELIVRANQLQKENPPAPVFYFKEVEVGIPRYKNEIETIAPDVVILFLPLRDRIIWPLVHW